MEEQITNEAKCEKCGKVFTGDNAVNQLRGHNMTCKGGEPSGVNVESARARSETATETLEQKVARLRKSRTPMGLPEQKWSCPHNDGYHYYVFNDKWTKDPNRVSKALKAGWEFVDSDDEKQQPKVVGTNEDGSPIEGRLMRIPEEIYQEDQAIKQKEVDKVDEQIKSGAIQEKPGDHRYVPPDGIKITESTRPPNQ